MFSWFYKKKIDDEFVILDVDVTTNESVPPGEDSKSSDVTPDILSDVTSFPEYTCRFYDIVNEPHYDDSRIEIIEENNSMEPFYSQVEWDTIIYTRPFEITPHDNEDIIDKGIRNMFEFFIRVDMMVEEMMTL
jgi:hypothetical protein